MTSKEILKKELIDFKGTHETYLENLDILNNDESVDGLLEIQKERDRMGKLFHECTKEYNTLINCLAHVRTFYGVRSLYEYAGISL